MINYEPFLSVKHQNNLKEVVVWLNSEHPVRNDVLKPQPTVLVCVELPLKDADATKEGLFQERIKMKEGERVGER